MYTALLWEEQKLARPFPQRALSLQGLAQQSESPPCGSPCWPVLAVNGLFLPFGIKPSCHSGDDCYKGWKSSSVFRNLVPGIGSACATFGPTSSIPGLEHVMREQRLLAEELPPPAPKALG